MKKYELEIDFQKVISTRAFTKSISCCRADSLE